MSPPNNNLNFFQAVRRGDKQILKLILDHGADFSLTASTGLSSLQMAKQYRLADIETTLIDHIQKYGFIIVPLMYGMLFWISGELRNAGKGMESTLNKKFFKARK